MPDLHFAIESMQPAMSAAPLLLARLRIGNSCPAEQIRAVALRCQIQIEPARRAYEPREQIALADLFGAPERWAHTLRPIPFANIAAQAPAFETSVAIDLEASCSSDMNFAAARYIDAIRSGEIPLLFLFSGTVFYAPKENGIEIGRIPWDRESRYRVPVEICKQVIERSGATWSLVDPAVRERVQRSVRENN
jgi:hypothetical protein